MKFIKNVFSQLHTFLLWALVSFLVWSWIFTFVNDAPAAQKVTVYCNVPAIEDTALAVKLEEHLPEGLKMIQVRSFDYVMFDTGTIDEGDIFILPQSAIEDYDGQFDPIAGQEGTLIYDPETGQGAAKSYIIYGDEPYYLFLGTGSVHLEDGLAQQIAQLLLTLP